MVFVVSLVGRIIWRESERERERERERGGGKKERDGWGRKFMLVNNG